MDNYTISINPKPISHPISSVVYSTSWNVTLDYNVIYDATIAAQNCAGESELVVLTNIEYGKEYCVTYIIFSGCSNILYPESGT